MCKHTLVNVLLQGFGRKHYPKDEYYEGEIKGGKRHGHGRMWFADGSFYDGQWANDMKDGLGLYVARKL